jgi:peptidoglycan/LPS O-acetylase OafA/YrhL
MNFRKISAESSTLLDFIRGGAAQLVVIGHGISFFEIAPYLQQPHFPYLQNIAVLIFFIISGFVISYSLSGKSDNKDYQYFNYLVDRTARIYTTFIPALIFVLFIDSISIYFNGDLYQYWAAFDLRTFVGNLFMLQDFPGLPLTSFGSARPFWTLAIEWWIYLFVGAVFFFLVKKKSLALFAVIVIFSVVPMYNFLGGRGNGLFLYWLFGSVIYVVWASDCLGKIPTNVKSIVLLCVLALASYRVLDTLVAYDPVFAFLIAVAICISIDLAPNFKLSKIFCVGSTFVAGYSYTLYLIHYSILDFLLKEYGQGIWVFWAGFFLSNFFAMVVGYFFEERGARFVRFWFYRTIG